MYFLDYEKLLDRIYKKLPEKTQTTERFEIPTFKSIIQGKQTIIQNFNEVANILRRNPNHLLKYLSKELATAGTFDKKRAVLQGKFKENLLNSRLKNYVEEYVLCNECKKPDTQIITFEGVKYKRCEACGARAPVKPVWEDDLD